MNSKRNFVNLYLRTNEELIDKIVALLSTFKILGAEEKNDSLIVSFEKADWELVDLDNFLDILKIVDPNIQISNVEILEEKNWNEDWEQSITPITISPKIAIVPPWKASTTKAEHEIIIEPKMSFGTAHHATTRLMCYFAEKLVKKGSFWIDVGTGTGILAILAKKLGASEVLAFDNNFWSIRNAIENLKRNNIFDGVDLLEMDVDLTSSLPESDGIFANLNFDLILRNLQKFYNSLFSRKGNLIISGILVYDWEDELLLNIENNNFEVIELLKDEEWIGAHLIPKK